MDKEIRFTLRLPPGIYAKLRIQAKRNRRSINSEIQAIIEKGLLLVKPAGK